MSSRHGERLRQRLTFLGLLCVLGLMMGVAHHHQPIGTWLIWKYAGLWLLCLVLWSVCTTGGTPLVHACLGRRLPFGRHAVFAFAAGLWLFATGVFVGGLLGLLRPWFFVVWPLALLACGARASLRHARPRWQRWRRLRLRVGAAPARWRALHVAVGGIGLLLVYIPLLTPANVAYDARWYHLGLAEHYATAGSIRPFAEGWFHGTLPQFASWLYTWALLLPGGDLFLRTELAAHVEFLIFLVTVAAVGLLVRQLSGGTIRRGGGVAMFAFPGLYLYDSNLSVAADHVLALWAPVLALLVPHLVTARARGAAVLLGVFLGAAALVKYQAIYLLAGGAVLLGLQWWQARRASAAPALHTMARNLAMTAGVAAVATSSHWLRNLLWHGNPLYPLAQGVFNGHPWIEGMTAAFNDPGWTPTGPLWWRIGETIAGTFSFSLVAHDWKRFHGHVPVFGALFPLLLIPALALRDLGRTWRLAIATLVGVLVWYATYHQDRYLQSLLPWMAAVIAVITVALWRTRQTLVRLATLCVLVFQVAWSADVPFLPTHAMAGKSPFEVSLHLASSTFRRARQEQHDMHSQLPAIARALPDARASRVLLHAEHARFGLGRPIVVDGRGRQGAIDYEALATPLSVYQKLRQLGVTHVLYAEKPRGLMTVVDDLVFYDFVARHTDDLPVPHKKLASLRAEPPAPLPPSPHVLFVTCSGVKRVPWGEASRVWKPHFREGCDNLAVSARDVAEAAGATRFALVDEDVGERGAILGPTWSQLFAFKGVAGFSRAMHEE